MKLYDHQTKGIKFLQKCSGRGALFWDMGTGKTATALKTFEIARKRYPAIKMLVLCPLSLIEAAWGEDTKTFTDYTFGNLRKIKDPGAYDILCCNYEGLISKTRYAQLQKIIEDNDLFVVLDESSKIKNHRSQTYKNLIKLRDKMKFRIIMSGTPCPNDYTELWTQMNFIRPGLLPDSFFKFRNMYFHLGRGEAQMPQQGGFVNKQVMQEMFKQGWSYEISDENKEKLFNIIKPYTYWLKKDECLTLPDTVDEVRTIEMNKEQKLKYKEMKKDLITFIKDEAITAPVILTKMMKLRQITGNFIMNEKGDALDISKNNPKINELKSILEEIGDKQVIIWAIFRKDILTLENVLSERSPGTLYGGTKDKHREIEKFLSGETRTLICNPQSVAHGLTFVNCNYSIYYSLDYSFENYVQSKGRIHRIGQKNKCTYIHILADKSIDQMIYRTLKSKGKKVEIIEQFMKEIQ